MVWDAVRCRRVARLDTPHEGNIFSVVWLPGTEDGLLATGAGDCRVSEGSEVDTLGVFRFCSNLLPHQVCVLNLETGSVVRQVAGHQGRVKRLATAGDTPGLVWSGAEDGLVRQWDLREKWSAENSNVLVNLTNQVRGNISLNANLICFIAFIVITSLFRLAEVRR